jgi:hypothetical protein
MTTRPIPVTLKLPELTSKGLSDRVLAFNRGQWEIGRLMEIGGSDTPIWIFDDEQSVDPDVTHWEPLPEPAWKPCAECGKPMIRVHATDFDGFACMSTALCTYKEPTAP